MLQITQKIKKVKNNKISQYLAIFFKRNTQQLILNK